MIEDVELTGYLDGELDPERTFAVERALASDSDLTSKFERLRAIDELLSASTGSILKDQSLTALQDKRRTFGSGRFIQTLFGTGALVLVLITIKLAISSITPWMATMAEIMMLVILLVLALTRLQSEVNDDEKHVVQTLNLSRYRG